MATLLLCQVDTGVDYYDVTAIDGVNLPVEMKPDAESTPLDRDDNCEIILHHRGDIKNCSNTTVQ